jgi:hypothetical protein
MLRSEGPVPRPVRRRKTSSGEAALVLRFSAEGVSQARRRSGIEDGGAVREELDFGEGVRRKEQGSVAGLQDF